MKRVLLFFCLWVACTAVGRSQRLGAGGKGHYIVPNIGGM